jgi:hypothetical protein
VTGQVLRRRRPGVPPYEVAASEPPERLVAALVRNLAEGVGGQAAYVVPADAGHAVVESWPAGLTAVVDAAGEEPVAGGGAVSVIAPNRWDDAARAMLRDTAVWLGVAVRLTRQRIDHDAARLRTRRLRGELATARARLDRVRDLERHRLVRAITATTLRDLDGVRVRLRAVAADGAGIDDVRDALDELIDDFRVVVRGVFPAMLPDRGPRAALEELAATLPRPVTFAGDLGRRTGWQLESGFYHAVAAALNLLGGKESPNPVTVTFGRDDALRARISAVSALTTTQLQAALGQDVERITVLGGDMVCAVADGAAVVTVRLAERIEPVVSQAADPAVLERSAIHRQVRELVRQGQEATEGTPERTLWDAVAERLTMPVRLAVVGPGAAFSAPGVSVLTVDAPADRALAEEFLADDGPRGGVAAVLCRTVPTPEFRTALRGGRHRVALTESSTEEFASRATALAAALSARAPVITARRAVTAMTDLVRTLPKDHHLRWAVDRIGADTHEFAELDLLDDLTRGGVLRGLTTAAARLLGADGMDPRARLGLLPTTTDAQVATAARDAVTRWRAHGEHPAVGGRDRAACEVLVRTAEGLLPH